MVFVVSEITHENGINIFLASGVSLHFPDIPAVREYANRQQVKATDIPYQQAMQQVVAGIPPEVVADDTALLGFMLAINNLSVEV